MPLHVNNKSANAARGFGVDFAVRFKVREWGCDGPGLGLGKKFGVYV